MTIMKNDNLLKVSFTFFAFVLFLLLVLSTPLAHANSKTYKIAYDYTYTAGYDGGKDEKAKGYGYQPEVVLAQPFFQMLLKAMKQKLNLSGSQEEEWDRGFRDGFNAGFKDGYYGYTKKKTRFN